MTLPALELAGLEVHVEIPEGPLTVHVVVPLGATAPVVPVIVALKARVELRAPVPITTPVATATGVALGTNTSGAETVARAR